jgi:hypothetical protein
VTTPAPQRPEPVLVTAVTLAAVPVDPDLAKRLQRAAERKERWHRERDDLIREAIAAGGGPREVARLAGLTHPSVLHIVAKGRKETT